MTDGAIRAFLAFGIPEDIRSRIAAARDRLRPGLPPARWTRPQGWHVTLKFLGEVDRAVLSKLIAELAPSLRGIGEVRIRLHKTGFFPSSARPRVAWVGGTAVGSGEVVAVVEEVSAMVGFARERRPWTVHVTQARLKSQWPSDAVDRFLEWGDDLRLSEFGCREVMLIKSDLEPGGAVYTAMERFSIE